MSTGYTILIVLMYAAPNYDELVRVRDELKDLRDTFKHTHVHSQNGDLCGQCGFDLRNPIHLRFAEKNADEIAAQ